MTDSNTLPEGFFSQAEVDNADARVTSGEFKNRDEALTVIRTERGAPYCFMDGPGDATWTSGSAATDGREAAASFPSTYEGEPSVGDEPSLGDPPDEPDNKPDPVPDEVVEPDVAFDAEPEPEQKKGRGR